MAFVLFPLLGVCQPGISEFYQASGEVRRWYFALSDLVLVLGAIAGLIGGLRSVCQLAIGRPLHRCPSYGLVLFLSFPCPCGRFFKGRFWPLIFYLLFNPIYL